MNIEKIHTNLTKYSLFYALATYWSISLCCPDLSRELCEVLLIYVVSFYIFLIYMIGFIIKIK